MASYLMSMLEAKFGKGGLDPFNKAHPHDWLVWEPGQWRPPAGASSATITAKIIEGGKAAGEALVLVLVPKKGQTQMTLGRGEENDLMVNDATLSRIHLSLDRGSDGRWTVTDPGSSNGSWLNGSKLVPGVANPLRDNDKLQAGTVYFTYYSPRGMFLRLRGVT